MNIIICDDDYNTVQLLSAYTQKFFNNYNIKCSIIPYYNANDITEEALSDCNLMFLDIYMPTSNGIELIKQRRDSISCRIIFVTSSSEHAIDAFEVNALHYLLKPIKESDVTSALDRYMMTTSPHNNEEHIIDVKTNSGIIPIPVNTINYIDILNTKATIYTNRDSITTYTTLNSLSNELDNRLFMRANRSYIINMDYISTFHADHVIMKNNMSISLSRKNRNELRRQYHCYLTDKARNEII